MQGERDFYWNELLSPKPVAFTSTDLTQRFNLQQVEYNSKFFILKSFLPSPLPTSLEGKKCSSWSCI